MHQLQMSKATLKIVLAHSRANPTLPFAKRKVGTSRKAVIQPETLALVKKLQKDPCLTAKQLKALVPALQQVIIRHVQKFFKNRYEWMTPITCAPWWS